MNPFTPTDGRVAATAIVTVTLEIVIPPVWDSHNLITLYNESARNAFRKVTEACAQFATVKQVVVRSVLTDDREEPEAAT